MRLIKENIERDGSGTITLLPEEPEDMVTPLLLHLKKAHPPISDNILLSLTVVYLQSHPPR